MRTRFDFKPIPASIIAEQWYCEKAVDLSFRYPNIVFPSEEMSFGTIGHEVAFSEAEVLTEQEIKILIKSGKAISLAETPFSGTFQGLAIKGYPDYVEFRQGKALLLLDFKFSRYRRVFPSQRIQVDIYGYLLNKNHLDTEGLICGIMVMSPEFSVVDQTDLIASEARKLASKLRRENWERVDLQGDPDLYGELYPFSLNSAKKNLSWAMGYWAKKRAPRPTTRAYKCKACSFNAAGKCRAALTAPKKNR